MTDNTFPVPMKVRIRWRYKSEGVDGKWRYGQPVDFDVARAWVERENAACPEIHHEIAPN